MLTDKNRFLLPKVIRNGKEFKPISKMPYL